MKKQCINWTRIISIAGITFTSTLIATGFETQQAFVNALLLSLLALFTEMKIENEGVIKVQRAISCGLIL